MNSPSSEALARLKAATKWMWSQGDYPAVARFLEPAALALADACDFRPGTELLDVAAGTGNFALAAARRGAKVIASDMTPRMIELGRARTAEAGVEIDWIEGDAEALPFAAGRFDVVATVFGAMFAAQPELVASELFRVCRPAGKVAMANYNRKGFLGGMAGLFDRYSSRQLAVDLPSPFDWGDEHTVRSRFDPYARQVDVTPGSLSWRFGSVDEGMEFWERTNAPTLALKMTVEPERYAAFQRDARQLMSDLDSGNDDGVVLDSDYLMVVATK